MKKGRICTKPVNECLICKRCRCKGWIKEIRWCRARRRGRIDSACLTS